MVQPSEGHEEQFGAPDYVEQNNELVEPAAVQPSEGHEEQFGTPDYVEQSGELVEPAVVQPSEGYEEQFGVPDYVDQNSELMAPAVVQPSEGYEEQFGAPDYIEQSSELVEPVGKEDVVEAEIEDFNAEQIQFMEVDAERTDVPEIVVYDGDESVDETKVQIPVRVTHKKRERDIDDVEAVAEVRPDLLEPAEDSIDISKLEPGEVTFAKVAVGAIAVGAVASASSTVAEEIIEDGQLEGYEEDEHVDPIEPLEVAEAFEATNPVESGATDYVESVEPVASEDEKTVVEEVRDKSNEIIEEVTSSANEQLCSLSLESELPEELIREALDVRDRMTGLDVTTAIGEYRKAVEVSPENLALRTDLADIHMRYGLFDDAINQYRQIIRRKPDSVVLRHRLACAYLWNENFEDAANIFLELAQLHVDNEQYHDAIDVLQTVLGLDPQNSLARRMLIDRFVAQNKNELAIHHLRQFVDSALYQGETDNAIEALKKLISLSDEASFSERLAKVYEDNGNNIEALVYYRQLSARYTSEEKWDEALAVCEKIVSLEPRNFEERHLLIDLYRHLGRHDRVVAEQFKLAGIYSEEKHIDEACELYEAIVKKDPEHFAARRRLVDCYVSKGNMVAAMVQVGPLTERYKTERMTGPAIDMYLKLLEVEPESLGLREQLLSFYVMDDQKDNVLKELLTINDIHERQGNYREAVVFLRRAIELVPERADLHCRLAVIYDEQLKSISEAVQEYRKVFELEPGNAKAMRRYAEILVEQRKSKEAAEVLLKLRSCDAEAGNKVIDDIRNSFLKKIAEDDSDMPVRYTYGELCFYLGYNSDAIEQFQKTRTDKDLELCSHNMLGLSFIKMPRMREMAVRQFRTGLNAKGHDEQEYLELRYNLASLLHQTNRLQEALTEFKNILAFDVAYRDVQARVNEIQERIAAGGGVPRNKGGVPRHK